MKKNLLLTLLVVCGSYAQESFILKNDGSRIEILRNSMSLNAKRKMFDYATTDKNSEKSISYKDIDYLEYNSRKFKTFKLNNATKPDGFFVLCETKEKTLISIGIPEDDVEGRFPTVNYVYHIIDSNNMILETYKFSNEDDTKNGLIRCKIGQNIKNNFSNCEELIMRLGDYDKPNDAKNLSIADFFRTPTYFNCSN
jgi:hypothetical protein